MSADLAAAIEQYAARLTVIQQPDATPTVEQVLEVLLARDQVQYLVTDHTPGCGRIGAARLCPGRPSAAAGRGHLRTISPLDWHGVIHPHPDDWWWFLEQPPAAHWTVRFDWLWNSLAVIWLMAAVALSVDVGRRFLSISPDTLETFVVLGEASVAFLAAGGALTTAGRKLTDRFLRSFGVPARFLQEAKAAVAVIVLVGLVWFRVSLPDIARFYNNRGVAQHQSGRLTTALRDFLRALSLDPNYIAAHYNLGLVYEDMGDFEEAAVQYRFATQGDFDLAFINLARLYILDGAYSQAASLLECVCCKRKKPTCVMICSRTWLGRASARSDMLRR